MDTNLIDSCREAAGETDKAGSEVTGEFKAFKNNGDQMVEILHSPTNLYLHDFFILDPFRPITITRILLNHRSSSTQAMATRNGSKCFKNAFNHWSHEVEIEWAEEILLGKRGE